MILHLPFYRWENWGKLTKEADDSGKWPESENRNCLWNQQWWSGDSDSTALIHHCSMLVLFRSPPPRQAVFSFRQELPFLENSAVVTASVKLCTFAIGLGNSIMGLQAELQMHTRRGIFVPANRCHPLSVQWCMQNALEIKMAPISIPKIKTR